MYIYIYIYMMCIYIYICIHIYNQVIYIWPGWAAAYIGACAPATDLLSCYYHYSDYYY